MLDRQYRAPSGKVYEIFRPAYPTGVTADAQILPFIRNIGEVRGLLIRLGWPAEMLEPDDPTGILDGVQCFQEGWAFESLKIDRWPGDKTVAAMRQSLEWEGRCSTNFWWREHASRGNGWVRVRRELNWGLEAVRAVTGRPLGLNNSHRDWRRNFLIGSTAEESTHMHGEGCDINESYGLTRDMVVSLRRFSGIGTMRRSGISTHLDVGGISPHSLLRHRRPGGVDRPAEWGYGPA